MPSNDPSSRTSLLGSLSPAARRFFPTPLKYMPPTRHDGKRLRGSSRTRLVPDVGRHGQRSTCRKLRKPSHPLSRRLLSIDQAGRPIQRTPPRRRIGSRRWHIAAGTLVLPTAGFSSRWQRRALDALASGFAGTRVLARAAAARKGSFAAADLPNPFLEPGPPIRSGRRVVASPVGLCGTIGPMGTPPRRSCRSLHASAGAEAPCRRCGPPLRLQWGPGPLLRAVQASRGVPFVVVYGRITGRSRPPVCHGRRRAGDVA